LAPSLLDQGGLGWVSWHFRSRCC